MQEITLVLETEESSNLAQRSLNGTNCSNNLWVLKPSGKSRGRGISVLNSLSDIIKCVNAAETGKCSQWVVQKYIENPLTIANRKFGMSCIFAFLACISTLSIFY